MGPLSVTARNAIRPDRKEKLSKATEASVDGTS